jgi:glycosyltransferase involved in cell wall biosynthesis
MKRVAIFMHGGLSGDINPHGFPLINQIVNELANDFDLTVFSLASFNPSFRPKNFQAYCVPKKIKPSFLRWSYLIATFFKCHKSHDYELLYSFWGYPMGTLIVALGKMTSRPSIVNILGAESANIPEINYGHLRKYATRKLVIWTCQQATELVAVSHYQMKNLQPYGVTRNAWVIPWGVSTNLFRPCERKIELPLKLIHVANLTDVKDQRTLLLAFKRIREKIPSKLRIVGGDFLNGKIQKLVTDLDLKDDVEFMGFIPNDKLITYYHWADAFILTSLSEGQNNSITEAMMCGVLPVGTSVGIMHDIGNEVGVVVSCRDYESLADKLTDLYFTRDLWNTKRSAALKWASTHDLPWTIHQLKNVLDNAC